MEKQATKKILTLSFLAAGGLAYVGVNVLFRALAGSFGVIQRFYSIELLSHGVPVLTAVLVFSLMQFNPRIVLWAEEVVLEVSKVVWPSRRDTVAMTIVVLIFVVIASVLLILIDFLAHNFVNLIIG